MFFLFTFKNKEENFLTKLKTFKTHFLKFLSFINLPCGHVMFHKKFGPDRFSRFDVYWIQTNKQTPKHPNRQTSQIIYRYFMISLFIIYAEIFFSQTIQFHVRKMKISHSPLIKHGFCHKLRFTNPIFATQCRRPSTFQTMNSVRPNNPSLHHQVGLK